MKVLILSFSSNQVNEDSFIPNKIGLTFSCVEEYLDFAKDIAKYAGEVMMKYFTQNNGASYKGDKTIVTLADTEINSYLIKQVKEDMLGY